MSLQPPHQPDYLGDLPPAPRRPGRTVRRIALAVVAVLFLGVVGVGAWGVAQLLGGGPAPAAAVPSSALGYLAVDLDPSAGQKVEAFRTLNRFPAIADELDIDDPDDLRRWIFDQFQEEVRCEGLDFGRDVEPWIGDRAAVAAVPDQDDAMPVPVFALQVRDQDAAREGITRLASCGSDGAAVGVAFVGDYALLAETQTQADRIAADAAATPLADDPDFQRLTEAAGDAGVVTGYVSDEAPTVLARGFADMMMGGMMTGVEPGPSSEGMPDDPFADLEERFADFGGAALQLRFADDGIEAESVAAGLPSELAGSADGDSGLAELPETTMLALGLGGGDGLGGMLFGGPFMAPGAMGEEFADQLREEMERQTGLTADEVDRLLGGGFSVAVSRDLDPAVLDDDSAPADGVPAGIRITGDPAELRPLVDKFVTAVSSAGAAPELFVAEGDDTIAVALQQAWADELAEDGGLGTEERFRDVVPEQDAVGGLWFDADARDWHADLDELLDEDDRTALDNLRPISAVGASSWREDDLTHGLLRIRMDD